MGLATIAKHGLQRSALWGFRWIKRTGLLRTRIGAAAFERSYFAYKRLVEAGDIAWLARYVTPGGWIVDVGANLGFFTAAFAGWVSAGGAVLAIEPEPANFAALERASARRRWGERVALLPAAAGESAGRAYLTLNPDHHADHKLGGSGVAVDLVTLDGELARRSQPPVSLIKIDVQGAEHRVIEGALATIRRCRPALFVEVSFANQAERAAAERVFELLSAENYQAFDRAARAGLVAIDPAAALQQVARAGYRDFLFLPSPTQAAAPTAAAPTAAVPQWVARHRQVWRAKPALRLYYQREIFARIARFVTDRPSLEIGAGPGFLGEWRRCDMVTDLTPLPWVDVAADVQRLPFADGRFGAVVGVDVLHHLLNPLRALSEIARVLQPGGRLILVEPWAGLLGYPFYRFVHHEDCRRWPDVWGPAFPDGKAAMEGNALIPKTLLADHGQALIGHGCALQPLHIEHFGVSSYLLTGGFQNWGVAPSIVARLIALEDRLPRQLRERLGVRALFVLQKPRDGEHATLGVVGA